MTTLSRLERWKETGLISPAQFEAVSPLVRKERFSVFIELNALLFLGVLSLIAGIGWVIQTYFVSVGDAAIISALTLLFFLSFYYCFFRGLPYSSGEVESPNMAFDYVLYAGCLVFALEVGYLETRFNLLRDNWDFYLLVSSLLFFALAYRFDNRLVLSLALSTLAGWFGIRISQFVLRYGESLRPYALGYGVLITVVGVWLYRLGIKRHFLETYLHVAANVIFITLLSGIFDTRSTWFYLGALIIVAAISVFEGVRFRRFAFVAYGTVYGYIGISARILDNTNTDSTIALSYLIVSGSLVILSMVLLARFFGREE